MNILVINELNKQDSELVSSINDKRHLVSVYSLQTDESTPLILLHSSGVMAMSFPV